MGDIVLSLGNNAPHEIHTPDRVEDGGPVWRPGARGEVVADWGGRGPVRLHQLDEAGQTRIVVHDTASVSRALRDVQHAWDYHSSQPAGWVLVEDDGGDGIKASLLKAMLEDHFGVPQPSGLTMLVTNGGLDYAAAQLGGAGGTTVSKYVGLSANATAPAATDTTLTGEIATAGGGLVRAAATYAHTVGASSYTLTITFTANGTDALPVTVNKAGVFTASSAGTMTFEDAVSPAVTFNASGDSATITYAVTV